MFQLYNNPGSLMNMFSLILSQQKCDLNNTFIQQISDNQDQSESQSPDLEIFLLIPKYFFKIFQK